MEAVKHQEILAQILKEHGDTAIVSEKLAEISDDYGTVLAARTAAEAESARLAEENKRLTDTNMRLFLKVGTVPVKQAEEEQKEIKKRSYDDITTDKNGRFK